MSDNPADSLRRELEAALTERFAAFSRSDMCFHSMFTDGCLGCFTREAMWAVEPVVSAALEAARADERERLRGLTRCICGPDSTGEAPNLRPDCPQHGVDAGTNRWRTEAPF